MDDTSTRLHIDAVPLSARYTRGRWGWEGLREGLREGMKDGSGGEDGKVGKLHGALPALSPRVVPDLDYRSILPRDELYDSPPLPVEVCVVEQRVQLHYSPRGQTAGRGRNLPRLPDLAQLLLDGLCLIVVLPLHSLHLQHCEPFGCVRRGFVYHGLPPSTTSCKYRRAVRIDCLSRSFGGVQAAAAASVVRRGRAGAPIVRLRGQLWSSGPLRGAGGAWLPRSGGGCERGRRRRRGSAGRHAALQRTSRLDGGGGAGWRVPPCWRWRVLWVIFEWFVGDLRIRRLVDRLGQHERAPRGLELLVGLLAALRRLLEFLRENGA
eukprot:Sspe_Gene.20468::Locus_7522_Transcript_1_1_Confidence_1.000_Length_3286::g.20468::m.20468